LMGPRLHGCRHHADEPAVGHARRIAQDCELEPFFRRGALFTFGGRLRWQLRGAVDLLRLGNRGRDLDQPFLDRIRQRQTPQPGSSSFQMASKDASTGTWR
jgi:hypothetical protein